MSGPHASSRSRFLPRALAAALVLLPIIAFTGSSRALPLFARKYSLPCTSCHLAAPRLNAFGMRFKQNGYRMPGSPGASPWDSTERVFPLAWVGNVAWHLNSTNTQTGPGTHERTNVSAFEQEQVEFHSAGTLAKQVTFHFDNNFAGAGGPLESGMAFVQFDDVVKDGALNFKAGIFDGDIPYLADSRKTTLAEYLSPITLDAAGIELNGTRSQWIYALGLINSARDPDSVLAHKPDNKTFNQLENVYAWLTRDLGGEMVTARVYLDQQNPRALNATSSSHLQAELSAYFERSRFALIPGYTFESFTDEPTGVADRQHTGLLEATVLLDKNSRWVLTARIEHQYVPKDNGATGVMDRNQAVLNLACYVNPNARFGIDWAHLSDNVQSPVTDDVRAFVWVGY